ncbi:TetR/AcrR family transcriptional regulator [Streptomyces sp. NPDC090106]|uniref:TetR/AcrR family transcriptional regulator n=1 Tax=Streptomyces sp. NPDC090106 TaxID=3365946 RepID=UPI0038163161
MTEVRRRGRPRSTGTDEVILDAAQEVLLRDGYAGLSMEKVAAQAGVGKPTVYRRWPSKAALVGDVTRRAFLAVAPGGDIPAAAPQHVAEAISTWFCRTADAAADPDHAALILALTAAAAESPMDAESLYLHHTRDQHIALADLMRTAVSSGEFRAGTDVDAVVDALFGSLLYLLLTCRGETAPKRAAGLVRVLLDGLRP